MCAIVGISNSDEAAKLAYLSLHALQHRGQEAAGIATTEKKLPHVHRRRGLVAEVFQEDALKNLPGFAAIGHTRYSTAGGNTLANTQPLLMKSAFGWVALAHNGNLVNASAIAKELEAEGAIFQSTSDTEVIIHLMARSRERDFAQALTQALRKVEGAFSLVAMNAEYLIAVRDPRGFRPLVMGKLAGMPVFASETCAFTLTGAEYIREVEPGEMIVVPLAKPESFTTSRPFEEKPAKRCIFEYVYLARPDTVLYGTSVYDVRKNFGRRLAKEQPAPTADLVIPVPDSGVVAAIGFAEAAGIPFDMGIMRSHYVGRTFIEPKQSIRDFGVKLKLTAVGHVVSGKKVVVVDDSLVRGTTSKKLVQHLREAGAAEVHFRISAPPTMHPCFYGVDTPTRTELIAANGTVDQTRKFIGADSLGYLSLEGLHSVVKEQSQKEGFCDACFSGNYPTAV